MPELFYSVPIVCTYVLYTDVSKKFCIILVFCTYLSRSGGIVYYYFQFNTINIRVFNK